LTKASDRFIFVRFKLRKLIHTDDDSDKKVLEKILPSLKKEITSQ